MNDKPEIEVGKLPVITKFIYTLGVLPTSYLMSMTYQEQVTWLYNYLQTQVIPLLNTESAAIQELQTLYELLRTYVNDYFANLDVQKEINNKLDEMAENGELINLIKEYVDPIYQAYEEEINEDISNFKSQTNHSINSLRTEVESIASGTPTPVNSVSEMTDTTKVYLLLTDGYVYYYNGTNWVQGWVYQATGISDNSVTLEKLGNDVKYNLNSRINDKDEYFINKEFKIDFSNNIVNRAVRQNGELGDETLIRATNENLIYIPDNANISIKGLTGTYRVEIYLIDKNMENATKRQSGNSSTPNFLCYIKNKKYVRFRFYKTDDSNITPEEVIANYEIKFIPLIENPNKIIGYNKFNPYKYFSGNIASVNNIYSLTINTSYKTSYPIKIEQGKDYFISRFRILALFDENMIYIDNSYIGEDTINYTFNASFNGYMIISYNVSYENTLFVCEGTNGEYKPYVEYLPEYIQIQNINNLPLLLNNANILYNKKYVALGDSFTHGDFTSSPTYDYYITEGLYNGELKVYPFLIGNRNLMNVINLARNGMTLTNINGESTNWLDDNILNQIPNDVDYITIKIGINDNPDHQNAPLGTIDSSDRTTFYGAYNYLMNYLITNFPNAKIGIIVSNGQSSLDFVNATINIAEKYGVAYYNESTDNKIPLLIRTLRSDVSSSIKSLRDNNWEVLFGTNGHPNAKCHEYESTMIENFLRRL